MTREEAKEFYPILQAFAEGKVIECRTKSSSLKGSDTPNEWTEMKEFEFWNNTEYRIKPKYRHFKNKEECWQEMLKHQPFGWFRSVYNENLFNIIGINNDGIKIANTLTKSMETYSQAFKSLKFTDGTLFGIKTEE